jgi:hypothetical protein
MISVDASEEIIGKMKVNRFQVIKCYKCGRNYRLGDLTPKLFIEHDMSKFRPPNMGGNGYNYDCPHCRIPIYCPRW